MRHNIAEPFLFNEIKMIYGIFKKETMIPHKHLLFAETNPSHFQNKSFENKKKIIKLTNLDQLYVILEVIHGLGIKKNDFVLILVKRNLAQSNM